MNRFWHFLKLIKLPYGNLAKIFSLKKEKTWSIEEPKRKMSKYGKYAFSEISLALGDDGLIERNA